MKLSKDVVEQAEKWDKHFKELEESERDSDIEIIESKNGIKIYIEKGFNGYVSFTSSVHWSSPVTIYPQDRFQEQKVSYSSGGTVSATPHEIAEAMQLIWKYVPKYLSKPEEE